MEKPVPEGLPGDNETREPLARPSFNVTRISEGFAFGHGNISAQEEDPEILALVDDTIHNSPDILVPVDKTDDGQKLEDDGCSDGRKATLVFTAKEVFKRSLNRAKVFGGAVAMTAATLIGLGKAHGKSLNMVFEKAKDTLVEKGINFGGHTDEHAHGEDSGCGAIDRAPEAMVASLKYEGPIRGVISVLEDDTTGLDEVFANFRRYVSSDTSTQPAYSGRKVMDGIVAAGKVVKKLGGEHRERRIILNKVRDHTVNQKLIRLVTGERAQVFAVDIWRLEDIAIKSYPDQPAIQRKALLSELVYTLAVAAVLTKGDLPVDMIQESSKQGV